MSVQLRKDISVVSSAEDSKTTPIVTPITESKSENVNVVEKVEDKFTEEITVNVASRLLQDYAVLLRGEIQSLELLSIQYKYTKYFSWFIFSMILLFSSTMNLGKMFDFYGIFAAYFLFGIVALFLLFTTIHKERSLYANSDVSYLNNVHAKLEKITTASYALYEKHTLLYWEQQELGAKIENAEAVLNMARKIIKKP
jgi:hypothetical protein